jgi:hypothetical protein
MPESRYDISKKDWKDYPGDPIAEGTPGRYIGQSAMLPVERPEAEEEDPLWSDYGKMILSGGIQIGSGIGWLANNFEWGQSLQRGASELSRSFMEDLSPQARRAMATEFTSRDEGQLWTNNKWSKAKLIAAQSLLGTAAGMGVGSILTRGLAAAGMTKGVTTAAGATVQVPTKTAGAIGYGLGEAGVAAPGSAAGVEEEIMAMSHRDLLENAADYRAVYLALENADPGERARRAKEILAKAAAGDTFYRNMVSTFVLSAPLGAIVGGYAGKLPLATTRSRSVGVGALGEATQEFMQSGAEKMGENVAMQRAGFDRPTMEGVLEEAVGGAMAGGMMGGAVGTVTPLDPTGEILPEAESPLAALARAEQDELDAALDAELAEQDRLEREAEDQALRDMLAEQDDAARAEAIAAGFGEREQQLELQREAQIEEEYRRQRAREDAERGPLPGEPETEAQRIEREYEDELREIWDIDKEEERFRRLEALQREYDAGRLPHLRGLSPAERITPRGQRQEEAELFLAGTQPAEGEIVREIPVPTAGRPGVSVGEALEAAQAEAAVAPPETPRIADRRKSKMGEPVALEELVEPPKPDVPPPTKAFNPRRDNIVIAAAKTRGLDRDAWAAEGIDPAEFGEPENAYGSKRAFRKGGMTPDEATEWAAEQGFVPVDEHGKAEPHAALEAVIATIGGDPVYTGEGAEAGAALQEYERLQDEFQAEKQRREDIVGEWDIEVDGVQAHITETTVGDVDVRIGEDTTTTVRMEDESNRDLVRAILQTQAAGEDVIREKPVPGAPQTREEQIAAERAEGKRIVDEMMPDDTGMVEVTEEQVNDLEDALYADQWKFNATEQSYRKGNRVAQLTELEEGKWQVVWETEAVPETEPTPADMFGAPELDEVADDLADQISRLTPESTDLQRSEAVADLRRLKLGKHPRADELAEALSEQLWAPDADVTEAEAEKFNLGWMPATLRVRIMSESAQSFSRMDKTSLQAYAIRIGISDKGTKIEIAQRIKDAVATIQEVEIDLAAAEPIADVVERKAKYATKKRLTKLQKEALVKAVALAQVSRDGEVLVNDLSARDVGGQSLQGLVDKGTIEITEGAGFYETGAKYRVKYMEAPTHPMERPAVPKAKPLGVTGLEAEEEAAAEEEILRGAAKLPISPEARKRQNKMLTRRIAESERRIEETERLLEAERRAGERRRQKGETEAEYEARIEREAIQLEEDIRTEAEAAAEEELGEIPGFEELEQETATSPESDIPMPTEAQKDAGNYKKAHITIKGILISIENAVGSIRNGFRMKDHYGYIKRTEGVDGDQVDVFVNPDIKVDYNNNVYIIDQTDEAGRFDEHKVMLGYASEVDAIRAYKRNYEPGWTVGPVTEMTMGGFKVWLADDAATKRPIKGTPYETGYRAPTARRGATREEKRAGRKRKFRFSKKLRDDARAEDAKASVNAPNKQWVKDTLKDLAEQQEIDTTAESFDRLIEDMISLDEALGELEVREAVTRAYDRPQVERDTKKLRDSIKGATIRVLDDYTQTPADVRTAMEQRGMQDVGGVTNPNTGDIYIFSDKITDADHANRVTIHEATHAGLEIAFGDELDPMLLDLAKNVPTVLQDRADEIVDVYKLDVSKDADLIEMAEELVAHGAEHFPNLPIIKKFVAKIRAMLRKMGFVEQWTENDVLGLIMEAQGAVKRRGRTLEGITFDEDVEVAETGEVYTIERDAQELLTQNQKRTEVCEKLKSCL